MPPQGDMNTRDASVKTVHWKDEEDDSEEGNAALIPRAQQHERGPATPKLVPSRTSNKKKKQARFMILATSVIVAVLTMVLLDKCSPSPLEISRQEKNAASTTPAHAIQQLGWPAAIEKFRVVFVALVVALDEQEEEQQKKASMPTSDISPIYKQIQYALDTFGMRAVYSQVFHELEYYFPEDWDYLYWYEDEEDSVKDAECDLVHGIGCLWLDLWWLWHYVGAITAEMLLRDGSVLLDGITGERLFNGAAVMKEIHRIQEQPYVDAMSFHAEHGFIWHYVAATMPNLDSYPTQLADEFCGDYLMNKVLAEPAHKTIGYECYHGFGHAVYNVVAMRQLQLTNNYTAQIQLRPHGGFALSDEFFCETQAICASAPNTTRVPKKACLGGIRHSYKLFSNTLPKFKDKFENQEYFAALYANVCSSK